MRLVTAYLILAAAIYAAIGVAGLVSPRWLLGLVEVSLPGPSALNEIRAAYGGQLLGLALVIALGARRREWRRWTLILFSAAAGGMLAGRMISLAADGAPNAVVWTLTGLEAAGALGGAALLATWPRG